MLIEAMDRWQHGYEEHTYGSMVDCELQPAHVSC